MAARSTSAAASSRHEPRPAHLDLRGGTVNTTVAATGTGPNNNTLSVNNTITGLPSSTSGSTVVTSTLNGNLLLAATDTINTADDGSIAGLSIPRDHLAEPFGIHQGRCRHLTRNAAAANTYTGTTTVNAGTLQLGNTGGVAVPGNLVVGDSLGGQGANKADVVRLLASNQIQPTAAVNITNSGLLDLNGFNNTIGTGQFNALTITGGSVTTGTGTLTLGGNVADLASNPDIDRPASAAAAT